MDEELSLGGTRTPNRIKSDLFGFRVLLNLPRLAIMLSLFRFWSSQREGQERAKHSSPFQVEYKHQ